MQILEECANFKVIFCSCKTIRHCAKWVFSFWFYGDS